MLLVQPLISSEFPKLFNLTLKVQIHTAIQYGKYAANMRTRQSISQAATGIAISDDANWSLSISAQSLSELFGSTLYRLYSVVRMSFSMP